MASMYGAHDARREINTVVEALAGIAAILRTADPVDKAEVYRQLGLKLTYKPGLRVVDAEAEPSGSCTSLCPMGDSNPHSLHPSRAIDQPTFHRTGAEDRRIDVRGAGIPPSL
jgi:hypothetical protein